MREREHAGAEDLEALKRLCAQFGLTITGARRQGVLLEVAPESLEALPDADTLRLIADELGGDGVRYVALSLDAFLEGA